LREAGRFDPTRCGWWFQFQLGIIAFVGFGHVHSVGRRRGESQDRRHSACYCHVRRRDYSGVHYNHHGHVLVGSHKGGNAMTAFNAVRFRVKVGMDQEFLDAHRNVHADWPGLVRVNMIKTGERDYCIIAEWMGMDAMAAARPNMIATLDGFRHTLEDLGGGRGVTDAVSGPVVLALK
jgi:hypothetical protein